MSEAKVEYRHHDKATELVSRIAHPIDSRGAEAARQYNRTLLAQALANAESAQPAERAGEWVSVELAPLLGVLAYLNAEIGQYHKEHHAPSRIRRAKELLEMALPPQPQPKEKP